MMPLSLLFAFTLAACTKAAISNQLSATYCGHLLKPQFTLTALHM